MKKIYACLAGNWACLNDDPNCVMGVHRTTPSIWYEESAEIYAPKEREQFNTYYQLDFINIHYKGKDYRINPIFIQIVEE